MMAQAKSPSSETSPDVNAAESNTAGGNDAQESDDDQICPICLSEYDDKAYLDACFHSFCYFCILQWSEMVSTCPLCKIRFQSIIHNVRAIDKYNQHFVKPKAERPTTAAQIQERIRPRFRYRTTRTYGTSDRQERLAAALEKRKRVYEDNVWVIAPLQSSDGRTRIRNTSPAFFKSNPAASHRLIPFLVRELRAIMSLLTESADDVYFVVQIVLSLIDKISIESDDFAGHLEPFLFDRTRHFQHEFVAFAQSPFDLKAFDERAEYNAEALPPREPDPIPLHRRPFNTSATHVRNRLMAELAMEMPWEGSPPLQDDRSDAGWESSPPPPPPPLPHQEETSPARSQSLRETPPTSRPSPTTTSKPPSPRRRFFGGGRLRSLVYVVSRPPPPPPPRSRSPSPTYEELELELVALETHIRESKGQLLRVLERIEEEKNA